MPTDVEFKSTAVSICILLLLAAFKPWIRVGIWLGQSEWWGLSLYYSLLSEPYTNSFKNVNIEEIEIVWNLSTLRPFWDGGRLRQDLRRYSLWFGDKEERGRWVRLNRRQNTKAHTNSKHLPLLFLVTFGWVKFVLISTTNNINSWRETATKNCESSLP